MKKTYINKTIIVFISILLFSSCSNSNEELSMPLLKVSENQRYLMDENGNPFFWLGDTGWLLFKQLNREDAKKYLENRKQKGFNVIQVMVLHAVDVTNYYGDSALLFKNVSTPNVTKGCSFEDSTQYDYWDHVDYIIDLAEKYGLYMGLVPIWGSDVKEGKVFNDEAKSYATFLAERYKNKSNIIWLNGGDKKGSDSTRIWQTIGNTINDIDTNHLITFHPFGRTMSSDWFHNESWLDFNMFQSGHRSYEQDDTERGYGPDNWRYVQDDYLKKPVKPTIDGEPSYEEIPIGLHDSTNGYWNDDDIRRYAYWSVFAGGCGFTYGHNAIMQFYKDTKIEGAFDVIHTWQESLDHPGATQMIHLKNLMLSRPYFERIPDQSLIAGDQGEKYNYLIATRGNNYAFIYNFTGRNMQVQLGILNGENIKASWFNPKNGNISIIGTYENNGVKEFDPPGDKKDGNDWVLILDGE